MGRRRQSGLELMVLCPWWVGVGLAVGIYFGVGIGVEALPAEFASFGSSVRVVGNVFALIFAMAGAGSVVRAWRVRRNLEGQSGLDSLVAMPWKAFEDLVGEVYRRQGYAVEEQLGGGADGGVDLILRRGGERTLVQCKRWAGRPVGAPVVRELFGVMVADGADAAVLVTTSRFTAEVRDFARGKPLTLVDGPELMRLVREVQRSEGKAAALFDVAASERSAEPVCPRCGSGMVRRVARRGARAGQKFWGCAKFPQCRGVVGE